MANPKNQIKGKGVVMTEEMIPINDGLVVPKYPRDVIPPPVEDSNWIIPVIIAIVVAVAVIVGMVITIIALKKHDSKKWNYTSKSGFNLAAIWSWTVLDVLQ